MNIALLRSGRSKPDQEATLTQRLLEAGRTAGHTMIELFEPDMVIAQTGDAVTIRHQGSPLPKIDLIINRPGYVEEPSLHAVTTDALAAAGYKIINGQKLGASKNKLTQHLLLAQAGLPLPRFAIARRPEQALQAAKMIGFPVIVKVAFGTHGKGVFFAADIETLSPIVDYLTIRDGNPVIIEEFIAEAERKDLRAFVVGDQVIAAMERSARADDVRANASLGGVGAAVTLSEQEKQTAIQAAQAFDLTIAGVDMLRSDRGPLVMEVNGNPGSEELERATGIDVAGAIIEYLET